MSADIVGGGEAKKSFFLLILKVVVGAPILFESLLKAMPHRKFHVNATARLTYTMKQGRKMILDDGGTEKKILHRIAPKAEKKKVCGDSCAAFLMSRAITTVVTPAADKKQALQFLRQCLKYFFPFSFIAVRLERVPPRSPSHRLQVGVLPLSGAERGPLRAQADRPPSGGALPRRHGRGVEGL